MWVDGAHYPGRSPSRSCCFFLYTLHKTRKGQACQKLACYILGDSIFCNWCLSRGLSEERYLFMVKTVVQVSGERWSSLTAVKCPRWLDGRASWSSNLATSNMTNRYQRKSSGGTGNHTVGGSITGLGARGVELQGRALVANPANAQSFRVGTQDVEESK